MKAKEARELTKEERVLKVAELKKEHFNLRCQHKTGQLENTASLTRVRKDIARVLTAANAKKGG